jgi:ribosomal protein L35AE/L33A
MYRKIMAEIAKGDILQGILRQITGNNNLVVTKFSDNLDCDIINSNYMLS